MTDQERKVMEMVLEALEWHVSRTRPIEKTTEAMDALRKALAQPEQEPVAFEDWLKNQHGDPEEIGFLQALRVAYYAGADSHPAPPSKPWVSLTDDEIWEWFESNTAITQDGALRIARAIEAKLKEKNT